MSSQVLDTAKCISIYKYYEPGFLGRCQIYIIFCDNFAIIEKFRERPGRVVYDEGIDTLILRDKNKYDNQNYMISKTGEFFFISKKNISQKKSQAKKVILCNELDLINRERLKRRKVN